MLSLAVNRRTALLFLGSGAGAVLMSACGGNTSNTESSASPLASSSSASSTSSSSSETSSSASPSASPSRLNSFQRGFDVELNSEDMEYTGEGYMYSTREKAGIWVAAS